MIRIFREIVSVKNRLQRFDHFACLIRVSRNRNSHTSTINKITTSEIICAYPSRFFTNTHFRVKKTSIRYPRLQSGQFYCFLLHKNIQHISYYTDVKISMNAKSDISQSRVRQWEYGHWHFFRLWLFLKGNRFLPKSLLFIKYTTCFLNMYHSWNIPWHIGELFPRFGCLSSSEWLKDQTESQFYQERLVKYWFVRRLEVRLFRLYLNINLFKYLIYVIVYKNFIS